MLGAAPRSALFVTQDARRASGTTLVETLAVLAIAGILLAFSFPSLLEAYRRQELAASATSMVGVVRHARLKALKEKTDHRVVFHDTDAITANRVDVEQWEGSGYAKVDSLGYDLPEGVKILGSAPMDSMDSSAVTRRGHCDAGTVYLQDLDGNVRTVGIKTSCFVSVQ